MDVMISASGLSKSYGKTEVLKQLNFSIERGRILGIIGPNGSGKTTLALAALLLRRRQQLLWKDGVGQQRGAEVRVGGGRLRQRVHQVLVDLGTPVGAHQAAAVVVHALGRRPPHHLHLGHAGRRAR